jgi:hypothetical protein
VLNARVSSCCGLEPMTWKPSISMLPRSRMQIRPPLDLLSQERQKGFALEVKRIRASSHLQEVVMSETLGKEGGRKRKASHLNALERVNDQPLT